MFLHIEDLAEALCASSSLQIQWRCGDLVKWKRLPCCKPAEVLVRCTPCFEGTMDGAVHAAVAAPHVRQGSTSCRSVPTTAATRAVNQRVSGPGAVRALNDVTSQFVAAMQVGSRPCQCCCTIPAFADFRSESSSNFGNLSGGRSAAYIRIVCGYTVSRPNAAGGVANESKLKLWQQLLSDPSQWWDNRTSKWNERAPDFKHKETKLGLWILDPSTPPWVKERLSREGFGGKGESRQTTPVNDALKYLQVARTATEAVGILKALLDQGTCVDSYGFVDVLQRCSKEKDFVLTKEVHHCVLKTGLEQNSFVANNLLKAYTSCGRSQDAQRVFDRLVEKTVVSWTTMIGHYAKYSEHAKDAIDLYFEMREGGVAVNDITYLSVLKACASPGALKWGKQIHAHIRHGIFESDVRVGNALIGMYGKAGSIEDARSVFENMGKRNVITWNAMISGLAQHGHGKEAFSLFLQMQVEGTVPNASTYMSILDTACASTEALRWVREVHSRALQAGLASHDLRVGSAFIHTYASCGSLDDARRVFDGMVKRNVITWNVMIGGLAQCGRGREAFALFLQMQQEGCVPDAFTYVSILNAASAVTGAMEWVQAVHYHAVKAGLDTELRVGNALVRMYGKCGKVEDARHVFDGMVKRDVITWNVMIGGLAQHGCGREAFLLLLRMRNEGYVADATTYVSVLSTSATTGPSDLEWVKQVHSLAVNAGLGSDLLVCNALVCIYDKCGSIEDARLVFEGIVKRDVISWNVMIGALAHNGCCQEAFSLFRRMESEGCVPDATTYVNILSASSSTGALDLEWVKEVHHHAVEAEVAYDLRVGSALVHVYAKIGSIEDARHVFDRMSNRNVITWTAMIGGLAQQGLGHEAFSLFLQMQIEGFVPNSITYVSILNARASTGAIEWVKQVHIHAVKAGLASDLRVGNALIHMYAKSGSIEDARRVFDGMVERDVISWTMMIDGLAKLGCGHEAFSLFLQMQREGYVPDATTFVSILSSSVGTGASDLEWAKEVHCHAVTAGLASDLRVGSALVHTYAKCVSVEDARSVFDSMEERDVISWNVMIGVLAQNGRGHEAFSLFLQMQRQGYVPDSATYVSILNQSASTEDLGLVKDVHMHAVKGGLASDLRVGNALVHMYAKSGSIDDARHVFDGMVERDVISWNVMISGLGQHGHGQEALELFEAMKVEGVKPDEYSFVAVLSACSHAGLVDDGRSQFVSMKRDYGIEPTVVHFTCMVDLLGRAGHLEEAKRLILDLPVEPSLAPWGALLGACRIYGNLDMALHAAKERLKLDPMDAATFVLLSNIYAAAGEWDQVSLLRRTMQERGVRKEPGRSWITVANKIHRFVVGDTSHPESKEIYALLQRLVKQLKAEGYVPDTRLVLHDIGEEEKELALCFHSEKLAIAYGLMHTPPGEPIRVFKNLRVCSDCHQATKFISKLTRREIVARDANRFHHFKDGVCSCNDYW